MPQASDSTRFDSLPLSPALLQVVEELGFKTLTPIQAQGIPLIFQGKDLIAQSKTGSGKTAAFALPILQRLSENTELQRDRRIEALVLSPTRELCTQVAREIRKLGRRIPGLQVLVLSGGQPLFSQLNALEKGVHIVVGTPGRLLDHLDRKTLDLSQVSTVVLDEADRMLDMGFQQDMERILGRLPKSRQTLLFSATFPITIEALSRVYQKNPTRITIEDEEDSIPDIRQMLFNIGPDTVVGSNDARVDTLLAFLEQNSPESAIVFCNLKVTVAELTRTLLRAGVSAAGLHGDLEQKDRDRVMARFRNKSTRILVATDVAARGIDIEKLDLVVNFDLSPDPEVYVHRIGRTGRAGKKGLAVSFATSKERAKIERIESFTGQKMEPSKLGRVPSAFLESLGENLGESPSPPLKQDAKMETLYIAGGRKQKMRPGDILGALTGEAGGLQAADIGKIEIHDHFSYVAVAKEVAQTAVQRLSDGRIKGRKFRVGLAR
ncbi:ATP-dependent RNA helicase DbpA [Bdellovibrionota bacterium FG-2]